jgi:transcriptional regulator with XRE-family HTH domain
VSNRGIASTGIDDLDRALGGLFWGDNVVWEAHGDATLTPFFRAIEATADEYGAAVYVTFAREPDSLRAAHPTMEILDARPGRELAQWRRLLEAVRRKSVDSPPALFLFDPLDDASESWGPEIATRFFVRSCPLLLGLGAIAYWSIRFSGSPPRFRSEIEAITQCVLLVENGRLRIAKAEGRPLGVQGSVFRYRVENGIPTLAEAPVAARLGSALRAVRLERRFSQSDLAGLAGVSPSAISQAERGIRGLSLETLLNLTAKLNITLDELLQGKLAPGYRLARRDDPRHRLTGVLVPLLDDPQAGLRIYLARLAPGASAASGFAHKGSEIVAVAEGLVQVLLRTGQPVLRAGEALLADSTGVEGWRNLGEDNALVFWILRDDVGRASEAS